MNLSRSGFREKSYFKRLKTQSKITAFHLFCYSHICVTFVLNSHPVCPLLYPKPLNIYFSCYQNSKIKNTPYNLMSLLTQRYIQFFKWTIVSFFVTQFNGFLIVEMNTFLGIKKSYFLWAYANDYFWNAINIFCVCECMTISENNYIFCLLFKRRRRWKKYLSANLCFCFSPLTKAFPAADDGERFLTVSFYGLLYFHILSVLFETPPPVTWFQDEISLTHWTPNNCCFFVNV